MAAVGKKIAEPAGYKSSNNYLGLNNEALARKLAERTVENSVPYTLPVLKSLPPDFTLLDVGCGPCSITIDIAKRYPQATILGLDSPDALAIAQENIAAAGVTNITLVVGDALDLKAAADAVPTDQGGSKPDLGALLRSGGFDMAHTHQVMLHVRDAARLHCELRNAVKPRGGVVCCRDVEIESMVMYPNPPVVAHFMGIIPEKMRQHGADFRAGRKHLSNALKAGFRRSDIEASVAAELFANPEDRRRLADLMCFMGGANPGQAGVSQAESALTQFGVGLDDIRQLMDAWREWVKAEEGWCLIVHSQVVCRRND